MMTDDYGNCDDQAFELVCAIEDYLAMVTARETEYMKLIRFVVRNGDQDK